MGAGDGTTTVRGAVVGLLRGLGMTTVFGNPGSTEIPFLGEWPNSLRYVLGLQEASVVAMADGYARASGRAAFCNLHSAAGVGHALGNVFTAHRNNAPLVITAGQQARELLPHQPFLGATDAAQFPKPYVKWSVEPARAEDVPAAIAQAWRVAVQRPRGPAFVSIPADDWAKPVAPPPPPRPAVSEPAPDPAALAELAAALAAAERPVLVVGPEADAEGAGPSIVALAERLNAPAWASPFADRLCFPEDHRLFAGHLAAAPDAVGEALAGHDLVLVLGAPVFTFHVAGRCALFEGAPPLWHVTTDAEAAARAPVGRGVLGGLRLGLPALLPSLPEAHGRADPPPRPRPPAPAAADPLPAAFV
ncbi:MAG: benzoylformate decarboxylase, partial [Acetobacteraceae bacterium]|nr:benzoylformate decarboxylase [Acetobacteraceae bacterium]